jgi:hypothetical protein
VAEISASALRLYELIYFLSMPVADLHSRRKRQRLNSGKADVYQYDNLPTPLRNQIVDLWRYSTGPLKRRNPFNGNFEKTEAWALWSAIEDSLRHEKGLESLVRGDDPHPLNRCINYFRDPGLSIDDLLDVLELTFHKIGTLRELRDLERDRRSITLRPDDAIAELNFRLREAGVGYQLEADKIIELNSQYIHIEAVKPALALLSDTRFEGPHQEFLHAHELYRTARGNGEKALEDAITSAVKAFESTIKVICHLNGWTPPDNATAAPLVKFLVEQGLIPAYLRSSLDGLATLGNKTGRHGQGGQTRALQKHVAAYALNQAAANIVMLIETFEATE